MVILIAWFGLSPMGAVYPLARTSSKCDDLLSELNTKGLHNIDAHLRLDALEQRLRRLNSGQGLGFRAPIFGVLDIPKLKLILTGIASVSSSVVPVLWLLATSKESATNSCTLTQAQEAVVLGMAQANQTCTYNLTVGPGGLEQHFP